MPIVDIDCAGELDKIHTKRMFHAFAQVFVKLIALEDERVNGILETYQLTVWPGPRVGIEYPFYAKQILEKELKAVKNKKVPVKQEKVKKKAKGK